MHWEGVYASRMAHVEPSPIMELIRIMGERPVINFASGLPDPAGFPVEALREAASAVLAEDWRAALQYGEAEGYRPLREWVAADLTRRGVPTTVNQVLIVSGSQQGIDLVARSFLQPGDVVLTENPSYLAALQAFISYESVVRPIPTDAGGIDIQLAATALREADVKLLYVMPNHQNPSGATLDDVRRRPLLEAAGAAGVPVLADEAYLDLRYDPGEPMPLAAALPEAPVLSVGTFSKVIAPGLRVAWLAGPESVVARLALLKQVTDLHSNSLTQRLVYRYVSEGRLPAQIARLRAAYREKRDTFLGALDRHLAGTATWTRTAGGMFVLLRLPAGRSASALLPAALDHGVAFVPGAAFFPNGGGDETMRLNFVSPPLAQIEEGVARLAKAIGHATCALWLDGVRILTDPMLGPAGAMDPVPNAADQRRIPLVDLPLDATGLDSLIRRLDGVLVTHLHRDHFDPRAAEILPKTLPVLCQPLDAERLTSLGFQTVIPVDNECEWRGIRIVRTGGQHGTGEIGRQMGTVSGFVLRSPGEPSLYLAGDTIWCGEVEATLSGLWPDVIVLNAGGAQFRSGGPITMTAADVVRVCRAAPRATVVAVHMETLNHCQISRADLGLALEEAGLLSQAWIPANGETLTFP